MFYSQQKSKHIFLYDKVTLSEALNSKGGKRTKGKNP